MDSFKEQPDRAERVAHLSEIGSGSGGGVASILLWVAVVLGFENSRFSAGTVASENLPRQLKITN